MSSTSTHPRTDQVKLWFDLVKLIKINFGNRYLRYGDRQKLVEKCRTSLISDTTF